MVDHHRLVQLHGYPDPVTQCYHGRIGRCVRCFDPVGKINSCENDSRQQAQLAIAGFFITDSLSQIASEILNDRRSRLRSGQCDQQHRDRTGMKSPNRNIRKAMDHQCHEDGDPDSSTRIVR